jgi:hypothetical protein
MTRLVALSLSLAALILSAGPLQAQIKFANFKSPGDKTGDVAFQEAKDRADLQHGALVALNLNDGTKVTGHVVRLDAKNKKLYVRARAGEAPTAYAESDIKKIDKATREVDAIVPAGLEGSQWWDIPGSNGLEENASGAVRIKARRPVTVKPAALKTGGDKIRPLVEDTNLRVQNVVEPEIIKQVSYNGTQRSVIYISNTISPGEREILNQLQKAENDLLELTALKEQREIALLQETFMQEERLRNQRLINDTMVNENNSNYPYPVLALPASAVAVGNGFLTRPVRHASKGVITQLPQVLPAPNSLLDRLPPVDPQVLAKARDDHANLLRAHAYFENGRLVAVAAK